jgi:hypothetical protein
MPTQHHGLFHRRVSPLWAAGGLTALWLFVGVGAWATDVSFVRLVRAEEHSAMETVPLWVVSIDRSMVVELTSEASVAQCEATFAKGADVCNIQLSPCLRVWYRKGKETLDLHVLPWACRDAQPTTQAWTATGSDPTRVIERIPIRGGQTSP